MHGGPPSVGGYGAPARPPMYNSPSGGGYGDWADGGGAAKRSRYDGPGDASPGFAMIEVERQNAELRKENDSLKRELARERERYEDLYALFRQHQHQTAAASGGEPCRRSNPPLSCSDAATSGRRRKRERCARALVNRAAAALSASSSARFTSALLFMIFAAFDRCFPIRTRLVLCSCNARVVAPLSVVMWAFLVIH